ncbi:ORF 10 [Haloarcula hispanica virus SH1]|uniref:ORF 10 n=1 Tax=Haloarcula hispanica SH1 virus TaxID=326574 RepID=Q4KPH7_9VIRU|nr:ORF 10 [Haloarcula hispanica virus SH1]AAY24936.1 ORF 10 [Haloarcula hispanica virus SH1]
MTGTLKSRFCGLTAWLSVCSATRNIRAESPRRTAASAAVVSTPTGRCSGRAA